MKIFFLEIGHIRYQKIKNFKLISNKQTCLSDKMPPKKVKIKKLFLTLIRAAGGVYDFRNFEDVYLCNGLSSELQNSCIPRKTSREYILVSTF